MLRKLFFLVVFSAPILLFSQDSLKKQESRLVRLIYAKSAELVPIGGKDFRKITGPAQFLHNEALIFCDTAIWDVSSNTVDAKGNVRIIQNQTTLLSDQIIYNADRSVAQVRGRLVELIDKENSRLRTHYLDYFTKDSLAMFYNGGSLVNKDSSTIESLNGYYYGKLGKFLFQTNVQMEADSVLLSADSLAYLSKEAKAIFLSKTHAWQKDGYLQTKGGWYDRNNEIFHFTKDAYIKTKENEIWADTLNYSRNSGIADLYGNIQILDTAQSSILFADRAKFRQNPFNVEMTRNPSVASYTMEEGTPDTLFFAADTIRYYSLFQRDVDSSIIAQAKERIILSKKDPLAEMYASSKAAIPSSREKSLNGSGPKRSNDSPKKNKESLPPIIKENQTSGISDSLHTNIADSLSSKDTISILSDSLRVKDSLSVITADSLSLLAADSLKQAADTTSIKFLYANRNVKFYRQNMQGLCDSLLFNTLDSLIRLFKDPVIWAESSQLTSDSIQIVIEERKLKKAEFSSSAFVVSKADSTHFNQIKSADIVAYFTSGDLSRFDAFGGVSVLFFFAEDSIITTMNEKTCKTMTSSFKNKQVQINRYYEADHNDLYPIYKLDNEKQKLKGFRWLDDKRPKNRFDVSVRVVRKSQANLVDMVEKPTFLQTSIYFGKKEKVPPIKKADLKVDLPDLQTIDPK